MSPVRIGQVPHAEPPGPSQPPQRVSVRASTAYNLAGQLGPAVVALACLPVLARALGPAEFGVLNIVWMTIGYFSLLDFGLGRALTHAIAAGRATQPARQLAGLAWTCWFALAVLGLMASAGALLLIPIAVDQLGWNDAIGRYNTVVVLTSLAVGFPATTMASGFRGLLEAVERFDLVNAVRVPTGVAMFLAPTLLLPLSTSIALMVVTVIAVRIAGAIALFSLCRRAEPTLSTFVRPNRQFLWALGRTGGWMTLANLAGALLGYVDRFLISAMLPLGAVGRYLTPQEVTMRMTIVPTAIAGALFPAISAIYDTDGSRVRHLIHRALDYTWLSLFPLTLGLAVVAPELVGWWLGSGFSDDSARVMQWMAAGVLANGLALTPFTLMQAAGRVQQAAWLQLAQLPPFVVALYLAIRYGGAVGAAACVASRLLFDCAILTYATSPLLPRGARSPTYTILALVCSTAVFAVMTQISSLSARVALGLTALSVFVLVMGCTETVRTVAAATLRSGRV